MSAIGEQPTFRGWVSVKDRLPDKDRMVCFVAIKGGSESSYDTWVDNRGRKIFVDGAFIPDIPYAGWLTFNNGEVAHWSDATGILDTDSLLIGVPLPEPPEEG